MLIIKKVIEFDEAVNYLNQHQITSQYLKAVKYLLAGLIKSVDFKKRQPKSAKIWSFRVSKKYRAFCYFEHETLVVFEINDHQ